MKNIKNLLLLLPMLYAGASVAQNHTTVYGRIDLGYGIGNGGSYEGSQGIDSKFQQWNAASAASVWGIKGGEDLGNGLRVYFHLEAKLNAENGDSSGFKRLSFVGLSGNFGSIQLGRQRNVVNMTLAQFDLADDPGVTSTTGNAGVYPSGFSIGGQVSSRFNSMLTYASPEWNGLRVRGGIVLKNDDIWARAADAKNVFELGAQYQYNNLSLGIALRSKPYAGSDAAWGIGAKYDFSTFVLSAGYIDNHDKEDGKGFFIGAAVPLNAFRVGGQIAYNTYKGADGERPLAWALFGNYTLSRNTSLYLQYGRINSDAQNVLGATRRYSTAIGITHNF